MSEFLSSSLFFALALSLVSYELGSWLRKKTKLAIMNPLLIAIIIVIAVLLIFHIDYSEYERGSSLLNYMLTPATVALAIPLYRQIHTLKKYGVAIGFGVLAGVLTSLVGALVLAVLFHLTHEEYVTFLPKSITSAIGMGMSEELGGIVTITIAIIVVTGIVGNVMAETVCKVFRIKEKVAIGLAIGTSSHAMGTSKALEMGEVEGAMSSLAIVLAGILTVVAGNVFAMLY